jgi:two-component system, chemotaxis family, chemotaxis protein CheY
MKLLLVDDSGTMRTIQKRVLLGLGVPEASIVEAGNGQAALDAFAAGGFDLVLTDWNMPVMDGLTLLKEIRQRDTAIPVVMVTTESERDRVVTAIQAGVSDYLVKPFTPDQLKEKLEKWVPAVH